MLQQTSRAQRKIHWVPVLGQSFGKGSEDEAHVPLPTEHLAELRDFSSFCQLLCQLLLQSQDFGLP